ncbi:MAG: hypothetical protein CFE26_16445 [Verrucomicrobiales bacterium VVV1]|nr:MAG: hypothetical protein CFE26_16445 [Verrucomicrobiales bacterium VVV1]
MNTFDLIMKGSLLLDVAGVVGLGLLGFAAIRLARREESWGGNLMAAGASSLLIARLFVLIAPHVLTREVLANLGPAAISAQLAIPAILLSFGLAGVVWGLWGHARWVQEGR